MRWLLIASLLIVAIGGITAATRYGLYQSHLSQMRRRYPFKAYLHGETLVTEDGSPLHFPTAAAAHRYERDYEKP